MKPVAKPLTLPVIAPTGEEWRAMTPAERERLLVEINATQSKAKIEAAQARLREARDRAEQAISALRGGIVGLLEARGVDCSDEHQARLSSCTDTATLQRWLLRATTAGTAEEVFSG